MSTVSIPQIQERIGEIRLKLTRDPHDRDWCLDQLDRCYAALGPMPSVGEEIWVTRDGRRLRVCDMEESHVRNALRMGLRIARQRREREQRAAQRKRDVRAWSGRMKRAAA